MPDQRTMLTLDTEQGMFRFRAAAIIRRHGQILVQRATTDTFWGMPGGRVEMGEAAAEALAREMQEELGVPAEIGPLRYVVESFFSVEGRAVHGLVFYFDVEIGEDFPHHREEIVHRCRDGVHDLEFRWLTPDAATLEAHNLRPVALRDLLEQNRPGPLHIVHRDMAAP